MTIKQFTPPFCAVAVHYLSLVLLLHNYAGGEHVNNFVAYEPCLTSCGGGPGLLTGGGSSEKGIQCNTTI